MHHALVIHLLRIVAVMVNAIVAYSGTKLCLWNTVEAVAATMMVTLKRSTVHQSLRTPAWLRGNISFNGQTTSMEKATCSAFRYPTPLHFMKRLDGGPVTLLDSVVLTNAEGMESLCAVPARISTSSLIGWNC